MGISEKGGLDEGIAKIAKYFDIKDVCVIVGDEMAYVEEKPRKVVRFRLFLQKSTTKPYLKRLKSRRSIINENVIHCYFLVASCGRWW
ncbi:hypothetical protein KMB89_gp57 [Citrobacter phage HCF1]|uniref:Uncharacterized protein n=1 Tax=Citrobacter phage HCF1 TaxID=2849700 RepID=A0ABX6D3N4_9CAUD|nr:hypothetical protein KMB89_gp57 [Citrobacter phage HCF1]